MTLLFFLIALLQGFPADGGSIDGAVMNAGGVLQQPLGNARLELSGPRTLMVTRTNSAGRFAFANLPPGRYRVQVTRDGFIRQLRGESLPAGLPPPPRVSDLPASNAEQPEIRRALAPEARQRHKRRREHLRGDVLSFLPLRHPPHDVTKYILQIPLVQRRRSRPLGTIHSIPCSCGGIERLRADP